MRASVVTRIQHVPFSQHCTSTPKRAVWTTRSGNVTASCSSNGTVDLYSVNGGAPIYEDIQPDDFSRPKRSSSAVNSAVYECVRIHTDGRMATVYLKRRDLLRLFALDPRDLRCIDPNLHYTRLSPCLYVRGNVILAQLAGVRLIITANTALLLDPHSSSARKLLGQLIPKLQVVAGQRLMAGSIRTPDRNDNTPEISFPDDLPFELDVLEAALHISISKLDGELLHTQDLVQTCLHRLPRDITPGNLDELRKAKSALVELESKSEAFREVLEGMMDDEDELKDFNLSSRVVREERRRQRERSRLERELERERTLRDSRDSGGGGANSGAMSSRDREFTPRAPTTSANANATVDITSGTSSHPRNVERREGSRSSQSSGDSQPELALESASTILNRIEASQSYDGQENSEEMETVAMQELRAMFDQEEEEQDLQEVEDLFEFYLQRATSIQTESERMLASARDLEESIGLTLSARRFEVQRLELRLSIGSFAAAIGAVLAGIFGMNLRSTLEESILGFWGTTALIVMGCVGIYLYVLQWTRRKKILG